MIAVDTSALMAIVNDEPTANECIQILANEPALVMSSVTLAEALIVSGRRGVGEELARLIDDLGAEIAPVTAATARRAAEAYARWGKGRHPAALNLGDCFAYALSKERGCPLLFVGDDFARTDLARVL